MSIAETEKLMNRIKQSQDNLNLNRRSNSAKLTKTDSTKTTDQTTDTTRQNNESPISTDRASDLMSRLTTMNKQKKNQFLTRNFSNDQKEGLLKLHIYQILLKYGNDGSLHEDIYSIVKKYNLDLDTLHRVFDD